MKKSALLSLGLLFGGIAGAAAQAAENDWTTLIDGTSGMENFNVVGEANWSATDGTIQASEGPGAAFLVPHLSPTGPAMKPTSSISART